MIKRVYQLATRADNTTWDRRQEGNRVWSWFLFQVYIYTPLTFFTKCFLQCSLHIYFENQNWFSLQNHFRLHFLKITFSNFVYGFSDHITNIKKYRYFPHSTMTATFCHDMKSHKLNRLISWNTQNFKKKFPLSLKYFTNLVFYNSLHKYSTYDHNHRINSKASKALPRCIHSWSFMENIFMTIGHYKLQFLNGEYFCHKPLSAIHILLNWHKNSVFLKILIYRRF